MRARMFLIMIAALPAYLLSGFAVGDDKVPKPGTFTYRVLGLFSKDREKDLTEAFKELADIKLVSINFGDAEITVEFVPAKAFPDAKPEQVMEQLKQKLKTATHHTFSIKPRRTTSRDKLLEVTISVAGLDCKGCCLAAYEAIAGVDGVEQATASFKEGKVTALIDPAKTDRTKLEESLLKRGVQVTKP